MEHIVKNTFLREWIDENHPSMLDSENGLKSLDYLDMDKFATWMEHRILEEEDVRKCKECEINAVDFEGQSCDMCMTNPK